MSIDVEDTALSNQPQGQLPAGVAGNEVLDMLRNGDAVEIVAGLNKVSIPPNELDALLTTPHPRAASAS